MVRIGLGQCQLCGINLNACKCGETRGPGSNSDPLPQVVESPCQRFCLSPRQSAEGERSTSQFGIPACSEQWRDGNSSLRSQEVSSVSGVGSGVGGRSGGDNLRAQRKNRAVGRAAVQGKQVSIVGFLQRPQGCLLPSASEPPTHAAGLGQTGETGSFRELDSVELAASTLVGGQSQRGGPLRGRPLAETAEGDLAGPVGGHAMALTWGSQIAAAALAASAAAKETSPTTDSLPCSMGTL